MSASVRAAAGFRAGAHRLGSSQAHAHASSQAWRSTHTVSLPSPLLASTSGHQRGAVVAGARGRGSRGGGTSRSSGFGVDKQDGAYRVRLNDSTLVIPEQTLLLSGALLLGLGAVIGPIIIGLIVSAISIGVTLSVGAFALSTMFLPMAIFSMFFFLSFGGMFGGAALLGASIFIPKILSLIVTGAGLAIGWFAVTKFLPKSSNTSNSDEEDDSLDSTSDMAEKQSAAEAEAVRQAQELEDFDKLLAERERARKVDQWRRDRTL